ncbi:MAG: flippase-like domain-containing protein [Bacilli bacterium]|nr:flippase-like domain-containing protein [Bacilli bacterium]
MADSNFNDQPSAKKNGGKLKYVLYILIVLVATGISLYLSLYQTFDQVVDALSRCDYRFLFVIVGIVALSYCVDALIILVFCRLYTRRYKFHQGLATSLVGQFYSSVTPGASGGQVMQVYTMKSQGVQVSNAASIAVMWSIIYQVTLILIDIVALIIDWNQVMGIDPFPIATSGDPILIPITPLVIFGFGLNLFVIFMLFAMSYSHKFHNFILHYVIGFFGKIRLIKNPDKTRENLRVQVENFKLELRRLMSNVPVLILEVVLFFIMIMLRSSIPYFAGLALHAWGEGAQFDFGKMMDSAFMSNFHQMVTGLIPVPGAAGVSEFFYNQLFKNYFDSNLAIVSASQIIWRTATFHLPLLVAGMVAALYRSRGQAADIRFANRKTFVTLQLETYDERRRSSDTMYETRQFSRKEIQKRLNDPDWKSNIGLAEDPNDGPEFGVVGPKKKAKPEKPAKPPKQKKKKADDWEHWDL